MFYRSHILGENDTKEILCFSDTDNDRDAEGFTIFLDTMQNLSNSCRKTVKQELSDQIEF